MFVFPGAYRPNFASHSVFCELSLCLYAGSPSVRFEGVGGRGSKGYLPGAVDTERASHRQKGSLATIRTRATGMRCRGSQRTGTAFLKINLCHL